MMGAEVWADSAASLAAALGLVLVIRRMSASRSDPLSQRFRAALGLLAALMLVRVAGWTTGLWPFLILTQVLASLVPLTAVVVAEGLLRRHAPPLLKWAALSGAGLLAVTALLPDGYPLVQWRGQALLGFQLGMLLAVGLVVTFRDRASLSAEENRSINRMLLSLLLILPLLAGDFRLGLVDLPMRTGAIGVLGLAWLSLGLGHAASGPRGVVTGFLGILMLTLGTAIAIAALARLNIWAGLQVGGVLLCGYLLLAIALEAHALQAEARADTVLRHLATAPMDDAPAFLAGIAGRAGVDAARLLGPADLGDLDPARLTALFTRDPLQTATRRGDASPDEQDLRDWLFARHQATHALLIRPAPLTLLVLNRPAIGGAELAELELRALQRMASLVWAKP
jgi:hypothetical protein